MTTLDIEIALLKYFDFRKKYIVPNVSWGLGLHECDMLIVTTAGYMTEVEIKISRADLLKDKHKKHNHNPEVKEFYFCVPNKLKELALQEIPEHAGLLICNGGKDNWITQVRPAVINNKSKKLSEKEILQLLRLGTLRIFSLKNRIKTLNNKTLFNQ